MTSKTQQSLTAIAITLGDRIAHEDWPEDDWVGLSPSLDANIYTDSMNAKRITVFHVEDGKTDTSRAVEIYTSHHLFDEKAQSEGGPFISDWGNKALTAPTQVTIFGRDSSTALEDAPTHPDQTSPPPSTQKGTGAMPETTHTVTAMWGSGDDEGQRVWHDCDVHEVGPAFAHFTPGSAYGFTRTRAPRPVRISGFRIIVEEQ